MKKLFAMLVAAVCAMSAMATEYKGRLDVSINNEGMSQEAGITILQETDTTYTLLLKNFVLVAGEDKLGVGNIKLEGVKGTTEFGYTRLNVSQAVQIEAGDDPAIDDWYGPMLGNVPLEMQATFNDNMLTVSIDIDMQEVLHQIIKVGFYGLNPDATPDPQGKKGDVNGDDNVDIADVNAVINIMLGKE